MGNLIDLTGQRFGRLTVLYRSENRNKKTYWHCLCDCGNEKDIWASSLRDGNIKSCGCLNSEVASKYNSIDKTGQRFGMLVAKERCPKYKNGRTYYKCKCDCGNEVYIDGCNLGGKRNHTRSCGCMIKNKDWKLSKYIIRNTCNTYSVYIHIFPNKKVYIGITRQDVDQRWRNGKGYDTQKLMKRAIDKYGWENIKHEVVESNLTHDEACKKEEYYIKKYNSTNRKYGYNITSGGDCGSNLVIPVIQYYNNEPVNYFSSLSIASYYLGVSVTTIKNYTNLGCPNKNYSFKLLNPTYDYELDDLFYMDKNEQHLNIKQSILDVISENIATRNKQCARKVNQYTLEGKYIQTFDSIHEAIEQTGAKSITGVLNKNHISKSSAGFMWKYYEGNTNDIEPYYRNVRSVVQIDINTNKIINKFSSMTDIKRTLGFDISHIPDVCKGRRKQAYGYIWSYADEVENNISEV